MPFLFRNNNMRRLRDADGGAGGGGGTPPAEGGTITNPLTMEDVTNFLNTDEAAKQWLQTQKDSHFSKSLKTWQDNNLQKLINDAIEKNNPSTKSPLELKLEALEKKQLESENARNAEALKSFTLTKLAEKKMDIELIDFIKGDTNEDIETNVTKMETLIKKIVEGQVNGIFKQGGRVPQKNQGNSEESYAMKILNSNTGRKIDTGKPGVNPYFE